MFPNIAGRTVVLDTETTGLVQHRDVPFGVSIVPVGSGCAEYFDVRETPQLFNWLREELPKAARIVGHHLKFDLHMLRNVGVIVPDTVPLYCTMVAAALLNEHRLEYSLDSLGREYLNQGKIELEGKGNMHDLPIDVVRPYAIRDAQLTENLYSHFMSEIAREQLATVMKMEMELLHILFLMEYGGVKVDTAAAEAAVPIFTDKIESLHAEIARETGIILNINSPKQVRGVFTPDLIGDGQWRLRDGTLCGPTKKGDVPSIDQHVLRDMVDPLADLIMRLRKALKTRDTFLLGHVLGYADPMGYVHTTFNQTRTEAGSAFKGTGSGRLSSTDPALQQINKRDKENAAIVRALFLADEGHEWLCMDHAQIDFRMAAHLMNDPALLRAYAENPELDYHQAVADVTGIPRNPEYAGGPNCKQLNLMLAFGASAGTAAFHMGMPYTLERRKDGRMSYAPGPEASAMFAKYHASLPAVSWFLDYASNTAKCRGFVKTPLLRRIRFPNRKLAYKAGAMLFQSWAADVHKVGLIACSKILKNSASRLLLSVHDEIGVSMHPEDKKNGLIEALTAAYCAPGSDSPLPAPFKLRVPIRASSNVGPNWYEASK